MDYLNVYREMISLRGLTDHTVKSYSTYIRSYLDYLQAGPFINNQKQSLRERLVPLHQRNFQRVW